jgi:tetratricopeptide (TPR) repeat protein
VNAARRIVSAAVRELANAAARDGDVDGAAALLLELPWTSDVDVALVDELVDRAVFDAQVLPAAATLARAELVLALVAQDGLELQRAAASGAVRVAAAANDAERLIAYAETALSEPLAGGAPALYRAECHESQGRAFGALGREDEATASFRAAAHEAAAVGASDVEARAHCELASGLLMRDDPLAATEPAMRAVERATAADHAAILSRAYGLLGVAQLRLYRLREAERSLRAALEAARAAGDRQGQSDWLGDLAIVAAGEERWDDAVDYHRQALELSREIGNVDSELTDLGNLAGALGRAGRAEDALERLAEAVRIAETRGDAELVKTLRYRLREAYTDAGHYDEALALDELLTSQPVADSVEEPEVAEAVDTDAQAFLKELFAIGNRGGDLQASQAFIDAFTARRPDSYAGPMATGLLLRRQGRPDEALAAYERALELDPMRVEVHNNLLAAAGAAGQLDEQAERYAALVEADPLNPVLRFGLGCIHNMKGEHDLALRELRESLRLGEATGMARLLLCAALVEKGKAVIEDGPPFDLERWSTAWGYFEECIGETHELHGSSAVPAAEALGAGSDRLIDIALTSNAANPPTFELIGERELDVLVHAGRLLLEAHRADPESKAVEIRSNRLYGLVQSFGEDVFRTFLEEVAGLPHEQ